MIYSNVKKQRMTATERARAAKFAERWRGESYERGEAQTFWNEFFEIFGRDRRSMARFEVYLRTRLRKHGGFIDLFWPKVLIIEHKSTGRSLEEALAQAGDYMEDMPDDVFPRHMLACDFANFHLVDLVNGIEYRFVLEELPDNIGLFGFMANRPACAADTDPVNQKATAIMGKIYESLAETGYPSGDMERLLTRLAFCMFADDAGIFEHGSFGRWLQKADPASLGALLMHLFQVLNTPVGKRQAGSDPLLSSFPYINGDLFSDPIAIPNINEASKLLLLKADAYDWSKVNPAIFGSMFQVVLDKKSRRQAGAHYTTEDNIMRVIRPLFLDSLRAEFEKTKSGSNRKKSLEKFQAKLSGLSFLDPACGSGNFLAIVYREIRRLELEVILEIHDVRTKRLNVAGLSNVDVNQFYGIEISRFSSQIAEISMWMTDHLMNMELGAKYGLAYARIPLKKSPTVRCADALETDWNEVLPSSRCSYVFGNPPYGGSKMTTAEQRAQVRRVADLGGAGGTLDYVAAWFFKAAAYCKKAPDMRIGFVATSSITQGEQAGQMWPSLLKKHGLNIEFAYRPFKWGSEAPGMAHVHVVIIGFGKRVNGKRLFHTDYNEIMEENPAVISPYLFGTDSARVVLESSKPINGLPRVKTGSKPIDGGHYIFSDVQKDEFLELEPGAERYMREFVGGREHISGTRRWILALHDASPADLNALPAVKKRLGMVRAHRLASKDPSTRKLAEIPQIYHINVMPTVPYLAIPEVSSERRKYIPIGYMKPSAIPTNKLKIVENAGLGLFGLLTSSMHMAWLAGIGGRLEERYDYSINMVYNTFPVPDAPLNVLEPFAQSILDARAAHPDSTLKDLYDPITMPPNLAKAHRKLDRRVDRLYCREPFNTDLERVEFLLDRYCKMVGVGV